MRLPDVQSVAPNVKLNLSRVGVSGVRKLVKIRREGKRPIILVARFDMFVDLPATMRGASLSRNLEVMNEVLEDAVKKPVYEMEEVCWGVAEKLLQRHEYAENAEVRMDAELIIRKKTPVTRIGCQELVLVFASGRVSRDGRGRKSVGAEVTGMTACPCTQEMFRQLAAESMKKYGIEDDVAERILSEVPPATHNQRGRGRIEIEMDGSHKVRIEKLIEIIKGSMSSQTYEILKREDEVAVIKDAHSAPKFVEDCVREMAKKIVENFPELPDDSIVRITQINEESIHPHNVFAEIVATMGELRRELTSQS